MDNGELDDYGLFPREKPQSLQKRETLRYLSRSSFHYCSSAALGPGGDGLRLIEGGRPTKCEDPAALRGSRRQSSRPPDRRECEISDDRQFRRLVPGSRASGFARAPARRTGSGVARAL